MSENVAHNENEKDHRVAGAVLVVIQFVALTILVLHVRPALVYWPSALVIVSAIGLMGWSLISMGKVSFRFHPSPSQGGKLQTGGAYRWVRHPMYTAALSASFAVVWKNPIPLVIISAVVVVIVLYLKLRIEEASLRVKFPDYTAYAARVPALIPFLSRPSSKSEL